MNTRTRNFLMTAVLLTAPLLGHAETDAAPDITMDACVKAFVSTSLEKERPFTVRTKDVVSGPFARQSHTYRISLKAVGKDSGRQVAKATCIVDRSGAVLSMNGKPVAAPVLAQTREVLGSR